MLLTITNLYPRPDQPRRGIYNAQLFAAMHELTGGDLQTVCLIPEWRPWRLVGINFTPKQPTTNNPQPPPCPPVPVQYQPVPYLPLLGRDIAHRLYSAWLQRRIGDRLAQCDRVFAPWLYPDGVAAVRLARHYGKPVWLMALGSDTLHLQSAIRRRAIVRACNAADGVICVWQGLADRLAAAGVEARKLHTVPNGADTGLFHYRPASAAARDLPPDVVSPSSPLVLWVGNLVRIKGPDIMLETFARVKRNEKRTPILLMLGAGPMRRRLEQRAERLGIADRVLFLGSRSHTEIAIWMNIADCLCLTSRSEGMPNVVIEALVSGLPVAAADVGAVREMLAKEPNARIVAPQNSVAMAHAVHELIAHPHDREKMADRHTIRFSWKRQAGRILRMMRV